MKKILLSLLFCAIIQFASSAPIDVNKAHQIAANFMAKKSGLKANKELTLAYTGLNNSAKGEQATFYVFTSKKSNGFVIASADDLLPAILGYSEEGIFDTNNLPSNFRYWLSFYEHAIPAIIAKGEKANTPKNTKSIEPLLRDMAWDQGAPYNNLAPKSGDEATVTGCVATAMAQIMRFHRWPAKGQGTVSYTTKTLKINITQDLGAKPFDWNNMPGIYSSSSTSTEKAAVAQLMYYAGVSVEMNFNTSQAGGSTAYSSKVPNALIEKFNYSIGIDHLYRDGYHYADWATIIRDELDNNRPVYYSGGSPNGGHAFVCDGYDNNGLFHINWGWSGMSNGYFSLLEMNPDAQGIGAGGGGGYIEGQTIIIGIRPPQDGDVAPKPYMLFEDITTTASQIGITEQASVVVSQIFNYGKSTLNATLGLALFNANNEFVKTISEKTPEAVQSYYGWKTLSFSASFTNTPAGNYRIYPVLKRTGSSTWEIIRSYNTLPNYIAAEVTGSNVIFTQLTHPVISLEAELALPETTYTNKPVKVSMLLKNNGQTEFASNVGISVTIGDIEKVVAYEKVIIPIGATQTVTLITDAFAENAGAVTVKALYDKFNGTNSADTLSGVLTTKQVNVIASSGIQGTLPTLQSVTANKLSVAVGEEFKLMAQFISTDNQNHFEASLVVFIFKPEGGNSVGYLGYNPYFVVAPNETVNLSIPTSLFIAPGNYILAFFYKPAGGEWTQYSSNYAQIQLTKHANPVTDPTEKQAELRVYPNPASDVITVNGLTSQGNSLKLFNMQGQIALHERIENNGTININHLPSGVYIAVITDKNGTISKKVKVVKQ